MCACVRVHDFFAIDNALFVYNSLVDGIEEPMPILEWYSKHFGIKNHANTQNRSPTPSTPLVSAYLVDPDIDQMYSLKTGVEQSTDAAVKSKEVVLNNIDNLNNKEEIEGKKSDVEGASQGHTNSESDGVRERTDVASKARGKPPIWRVYVRKNKKKKENDDVAEGVTGA